MLSPSLVLPPVLSPGQTYDGPVTFFTHFVTSGIGTTIASEFATTANGGQWLSTITNGTNWTIQDLVTTLVAGGKGGSVVGGVVMAAITGTNNDKVSSQVNGEAFAILPRTKIKWEARVATSAIAGTIMSIGLSKTGTAIAANGGATLTVTDFIGFLVRGTSGLILPVVKGASTETLPTIISATAPAFVNSTWTILGFEIDYKTNGSYEVRFYVDGQLIATHRSTANNASLALPLATIGLTPTMEGMAQASTAWNFFCDYVLCVQSEAR